MQQMLGQMRQAPIEQIVAEIANVLLQAIQVKLGRPDARVLIDVVAGLTQATEGRIEPALHGQLAKAVTQLRLAQVETEGQAGAGAGVTPTAVPGGPTAGGPGPGGAAPGPAPVPPTPPSGAPAGAPGAPGAPGGASRLWVPGR
jgi:hypothetical protein